MPTNAAGISAAQTIVDLATTINPNMTAQQLSNIFLLADQIVDQLVLSANATKIGQVAGFTGSQYPGAGGGSQNAPGNPGDPNGQNGQGDPSTS